jgi:hypothetical protein
VGAVKPPGEGLDALPAQIVELGQALLTELRASSRRLARVAAVSRFHSREV